ncbi:hypothetical protein P1J78_08600 [Psychromarinibacter sp. C21-152]|uniref:Lipoprotein n=1 Tax=Psychromarinibacter sediminicola TaxID=3033385 RepID=A0AAE3T819_9RHOB|nr:hypothetical protein [Psychromarinibacter sediminicola]MDF0600787.1 hypothetical protein [Psychromarinibacter sediminicola]
MNRAVQLVLALAAMAVLSACDYAADLDKPPVDLGPFKLGHNLVVARDPTVGPGSIKVTEAEWQEAIEGAVDARFGRYDGDRLYHLGMSVDGYFLTSLDAGVPGVPSLKSVLLMTVTLWDDALGRKLNEEAHEISVISAFSSAGPFPTKDRILEALSAQAAKQIEAWLRKNPEWFEPPFE